MSVTAFIAITLRYIFALSHNASTLWRKVTVFIVIALDLLKALSLLKVIAFIVIA
jgi:hypothetical protein